MYSPQALAMADILTERGRQEAKWGPQNHDPFTYLAILTEEVGELAQAALQNKFGGAAGSLEHLRLEAVQVAAVAIAIVECLDRENWSWPVDPDAPLEYELTPIGKAVGKAYRTCTRDHNCLEPLEGPCNGFPRKASA